MPVSQCLPIQPQTAKTIFAWTKIVGEQKILGKNENSAIVVAVLLPHPLGRRVVKRGHPYPLSSPSYNQCGIFNSFTNMQRWQKGFRSSAWIFLSARSHDTSWCHSCAVPKGNNKEMGNVEGVLSKETTLFAVVFYGSPRPPPPSPDTIAMAPLMDQLTIKTLNPKCRLFLNIHL